MTLTSSYPRSCPFPHTMTSMAYLSLTTKFQVVRARYGLDGPPPRTLEDIGRDLRITRERVRQIETRALHKLRQPYRNYRLRDCGLDQLLVHHGMIKPTSESIAAAAAAIAEAEAPCESAHMTYMEAKMGGSSGKSEASPGGLRSVLGAGGAGGAELEEAEDVSSELGSIESKRKLLDDAWNQQLTLDGLDQRGREGSVDGAVKRKSLSMAT